MTIKLRVRDSAENRMNTFWVQHIGKEGTAEGVGPDGMLEGVLFPGTVIPTTARADRFDQWSQPAEGIVPDGEKTIQANLPDDALFGRLRCTKALNDVVAERARQERKWGPQNHDPYLYLTILGEEYGETCKAALELRFSKDPEKWRKELRLEAVQTAAVALALVECLDRDLWVFGSHGDPSYREGAKT